MKNQLFPKEFINSSLEHYTFGIRKSTISIYSIILLIILTTASSLPFITIDVTSKSRGAISSEHKNKTLYTAVSARVRDFNIRENKLVSPGDTILMLDDSSLDREIEIHAGRLANIKMYLNDLSSLIQIYNPEARPRLSSSKFRLAFNEFQNFFLIRPIAKVNSLKTY